MKNLFLCFLLLMQFKIVAQYKEPTKCSIGTIVLNGFIHGTGFVCLHSNKVITCAHVIDTTKKLVFHLPVQMIFSILN